MRSQEMDKQRPPLEVVWVRYTPKEFTYVQKICLERTEFVSRAETMQVWKHPKISTTPPPLLCLWWRTTRAGLFQPQQSIQQTDATVTHLASPPHPPRTPQLGSRDSAGSLIATCGWPGFRLPWRQASLSSQTTQYLTGPINMGGLWWMECCQAWTEFTKAVHSTWVQDYTLIHVYHIGLEFQIPLWCNKAPK